MGIKFKQGIIVVLIVFTTLTLLSCFKKRDTEDPSAPIVNTIRLEDGELFLILNHTYTKSLGTIASLSVNDYNNYDKNITHNYEISNSIATLSRYNSKKNLVVDEINSAVLLRTKGLTEKHTFQNGKYVFVINSDGTDITIVIEVTYQDGEFCVLSERYDTHYVEHRNKHYINTYYEE